jgi:hypothetical protein
VTCGARIRIADAIRSAMVWINSYKRVYPVSPLSDIGESGYGPETGFEAMYCYQPQVGLGLRVGLGQRRRDPATLLPARPVGDRTDKEGWDGDHQADHDRRAA